MDLTPGFVDLQKFVLSDRYHLTASTLARVCPSMTGLMVWITDFNCCRTCLLLLLSNVFLKVRAVYFKVDCAVLGVFKCSACSAGALPTCTSSTINFLGVEDPFLNEVGPSCVVWRNCCFAECVGALSQLLKCFSKLLAWLMALPQWRHFSFLMGGWQWCCLSSVSFEKNLAHFLHLCWVLSFYSNIFWTDSNISCHKIAKQRDRDEKMCEKYEEKVYTENININLKNLRKKIKLIEKQ